MVVVFWNGSGSFYNVSVKIKMAVIVFNGSGRVEWQRSFDTKI